MRKRLFLAINLNKTIKKDLVKIQEVLKKKTAAKTVKWVEEENLHISLLFLGNISEKRLAIILRKLAKTTKIKGVSPFKLSLAKVGFFPNEKNPRVIWLGLSGEVNSLRKLYQRVAKALEKENIFSHYRFIPHITLGRVRKGKKIHFSLSKKEEKIFPAGREFKVKSFALMESLLSAKGPRYFLLKEFVFS